MTDRDYDLRSSNGALLRLRRAEGESDADYARRRREHAARAATGRTYVFDRNAYEEVSGPTPNGALVAHVDELAAIARAIVDDQTLEAVVRVWREVLTSALPEPVSDDVAVAIVQHATMPGFTGPESLPDRVAERLKQLADYVPIIDGPLETEEPIDAEAVAATRLHRNAEIAEQMTGLHDVAAIEAVLELARDQWRRRR